MDAQGEKLIHEVDTLSGSVLDIELQDEKFIPTLPESDRIEEAERKSYSRELRAYFLSGDKTEFSKDLDLTPLLLAPYLRASVGVPGLMIYDHQSRRLQDLHQVLDQAVRRTSHDHDEEWSDLLRTIETHIRDSFLQDPDDSNWKSHVSGLEKLLDDPGKEPDQEEFKAEREKLIQSLIQVEGSLLCCSPRLPFQMLDLQLDIKEDVTAGFLIQIDKAIAGLRELLTLHQKSTGQSRLEDQFGPAEILISFDKLTDLVKGDDKGLPETRLKRIEGCLSTLEEARTFFMQYQNILFVRKALMREFNLKELQGNTRIMTTAGNACRKAKQFFEDHLQSFVQFMASIRLADLEVNEKYVEDLHTSYFSAFTGAHLTDQEWLLFPRVIVVEESRKLMEDPRDFLELSGKNLPLKILAINRLGDINPSDHTVRGFRRGLTSLALSQRNTYIYQGVADDPADIHRAIGEGLSAPVPALWNLLVSNPRSENIVRDLVLLKAANASRFYPSIEFKVQGEEGFGTHFDLKKNEQPEGSFLESQLKIKTSGGDKTESFRLTMADFFALNPEETAKLEIIPPSHWNEDQIPVDTYLQISRESRQGKVPFIWMVDEEDVLHRAAIPFSWMTLCKEHWEYWRFIQELSGVHNIQLQRAIDGARMEWERQKEAEIEEFEKQAEVEKDKIREEAISQAIGRLVQALINPSKKILKSAPVSTGDSTRQAARDSEAARETELQKVPAEAIQEGNGELSSKTGGNETDKKTAINPDVWVETFRCTSCNDCIEALPGVFKYNEDKQAVVHNPKGGTYAKIVSTAEKCPARCIHPGLPQNPDEPGLDKLLKRAEKFN